MKRCGQAFEDLVCTEERGHEQGQWGTHYDARREENFVVGSRPVRLAFVVPGPPVASERVQKVPIRKRNGKLGLRAWTPEKSKEYMQRVEAFARSAMASSAGWRDLLLDERIPLRVHMHFVRPAWRGDLDNLQKNVLDGMQKAGVYANDNRVTQILASVHTGLMAKHRTEIIVEAATPIVGPLWKTIAIAEGWRPKGETTCENR